MKTCSVLGCGRPHSQHGYCGMHAERWRKWGDPEKVIVRPTRAEVGCLVVGCAEPHNAKGLCKGHYDIWVRTGGTARARRPKGTGHVDPFGYVYVRGQRQHRIVANAPTQLVVHHLDGNPGNNHPDNLALMTPAAHARLHTEHHFTSETGRAAALERWRTHRQ